MIARASCYFVLVLTRYMIFSTKGQSTVTVTDGCENGELKDEAIRHLNEQVQDMRKLLADSFQQLKNVKGQSTVTEGCENVEANGEAIRLLNEQVQNVRKLLNESFQQLKNQQDSVMKRLEVIERRPHENNMCFKNQTQNSWILDIVYGMDVGEIPILLSATNDWIVLMHRFDGSVDFNRNWIDYKNGFGNIRRGEFWIGNEKIHRLTNRFVYTFRTEMYANGTWYYAEYSTFSLDSETNKYAIHLSGFSGNAGDMFTDTSSNYCHGGMNFSTSDNDNDRYSGGNCAEWYRAGWWFNNCHVACLTCPFNHHFRWEGLNHLSIGGGIQGARMMMRSK